MLGWSFTIWLHGGFAAKIPVRALHRGDPDAEAADKVWYRAPGFWLERNPD
jgi:hypothetical protein